MKRCFSSPPCPLAPLSSLKGAQDNRGAQGSTKTGQGGGGLALVSLTHAPFTRHFITLTSRQQAASDGASLTLPGPGTKALSR